MRVKVKFLLPLWISRQCAEKKLGTFYARGLLERKSARGLAQSKSFASPGIARRFHHSHFCFRFTNQFDGVFRPFNRQQALAQPRITQEPADAREDSQGLRN